MVAMLGPQEQHKYCIQHLHLHFLSNRKPEQIKKKKNLF